MYKTSYIFFRLIKASFALENMFPVPHKVVMYANKVDKQEASMVDNWSLIKHVLRMMSISIAVNNDTEWPHSRVSRY